MLTPFVEIPVELKEEISANFIQPKFFERTWVANYQKHDDMVQVKITLEACDPRYKRPYAYQNAVIVIGNSKIVLPLSGAWFGETDNVSEYQNAILCFVDSVLRASAEDTNAALGLNFSWENFCTYKKPLKRLVAPFLINQEYPELWSDVDVCCDKFQEIGERLIGTFDIFEIDELLCQSRVLSGIRKPIPRERSPRNCLHLLMA
ncbi:hypothetical protein OTK49_00790 [Vibrio coralliirubri]|uniref:hypothetical protein n=1 Tax=Vibrio coralliirubri TaxID=1516159 RepID=UPI0022842060|nr:hypothetical protein [Vibrio coralliirubri]MCY9861067.1 hypothetical protein [Vibrio coralliirubri]